MVRESRHLKISNVPADVTVGRLQDLFKRYGRVQKVEILRDHNAIVSFMDLKSATKAVDGPNELDKRPLTATYYEPSAMSVSSAVIEIHENSKTLATPSASRYGTPQCDYNNTSSGGCDREPGYSRSNRQPNEERQVQQRRYQPAAKYGSAGANSASRGGIGTTNGGRQPWRDEQRGSQAGFNGGSSRYGESDAGRQQGNESRSSIGGGGGQGQTRGSRRDRSVSPTANRQAPHTPSSSRSHSHSGSDNGCSAERKSSDRRATSRGESAMGGEAKPAIIVKNLPIRAADHSIKDGLFHKYKKHGKVVFVKVVGEGENRYACVAFRRLADVEKMMQNTKDEMFLGSKIQVSMAPPGLDIADDNEKMPLVKDYDEYHPQSSRTLYIGNLENRVNENVLRDLFSQFGDIFDVDIKNRETPAPFAFIQFSDISSVVRAIHKMDSEYMGKNKLKLGFGKTLPTHVVWMDGIADFMTTSVLARKMSFHGTVTDVFIDHGLGQALVHYEFIESAQKAVADMKGRQVGGRKVQIDYASRELQDVFIERLEARNRQYIPKTDYHLEGGESLQRSNDYGMMESYYPPADSMYSADRGGVKRPYRKPNLDPRGPRSSYDSRNQFDSSFNSKYNDNGANSQFERRSSGERYQASGSGERGYRNHQAQPRRSASPSAHYKSRYRNNSRSPNRFLKNERGAPEHIPRRRSLSKEDAKGRTAADSRHSSRMSGSRRSKSQSPPSNRSHSPLPVSSRRFSGRSGNNLERNQMSTPTEPGDVQKPRGETSPNRKFQNYRSSGAGRENRHRSTSSSSRGSSRVSSKGRSSRGTDMTPKDSSIGGPSAPRPTSPPNSPPTSARSSSSSSSSSSSRSSTPSSRSSSSSSRSVSPTPAEARKKLSTITSKLLLNVAEQKPNGPSPTVDNTDVMSKEELGRLQKQREQLLQMLEGLDEDGEEQKSPSNGGVGGKKPKLKDVFDLSWSAKIVTKKLEMLPKTSDDNNTENVEKSTDNEIAGFSLDHLPSQETLLSMNDVMKEAPQPVPAPVISARYSTSTTPSLMAKSEFVESSAPESLVATQTAKQERQMTPSKEGESISAQKTLTSVKSINHPTEAKPVGHTLTKSSSSESDTTASMPTKPIVGVTTPKLGNTKGASIPEIPLEPTVAIATLLDPRKQIFEPSRPLNLPLLKFAQGRPKPPPLKLDVPKRPREPMLSPMGSGGSPATDRTPDLLRRKCSDPDGVSSDPENLAQTPTSAAFLENSGTAGRHSAGSSDLFAMSPPPSPGRPSLEERIKALDEKFVILEKAVKAVKTEPVGPSKPGTTSLATGSVPTQVASAAAAIAAANVDYKRYTIKKKTAGANPAWEPPISSFGTVTTGPSVGAILKSSIFDQDTQRLSSIEEKYTPGTYQRPPEPQESEMISPAGRLTTPLTLAIPSTLMGSSVTSPHNFYDNHDGSQRRLSDTQLLTGVNRPLPKPITPGSAAPSHGILKNPITPTGGLAPSQFPFPSSDPRLMISPTVPLSDPRIASRLKSPGADSSLSAPITPVVTVPASKPPMPYDIVKPTVTPQPVRPLVTPQTPITQNRSAAQKNEIPSGYNKPNSGGNVTAPRPEKTFGHTGNRPNPVCVGGKVAMRTTTQGKGDGKDAKNRDLDELFKASDIIERKAPPEKPKEPKDGDLTKKSAVGMPQKANKKPEESGGKISGATESKIDGVKKIPKLAEKRSDANNKGKEKVKSDKKDIQTIVKKRPDEVGKNSTDPEKKKSKEVKSQQSTKSSVATSSKVKPIQKTKVKKSHSKEQTDSDSEESSSNSDSDSDEERLMAKNANSKEWQEVLAALGDEPIGLSMYDRVKRRSSTLRVGPSKSPGEMKDKFSKLKEKRQSSKQHSEDSNGSRKLKNVRLEDDSSEDEDQDQRGNQSVSGQSSSSSEGEEETAKSTSEAHNSDKEKSSAATKFRVDDVFTSDEDDKDEKTEMKEKPKEKEGKTKLSAQLSASDGKKKEEKKVEKSSSDKNVDKTVKNRKRNLSGDERTEMKSTKPAKDGEEPPKKQSKSDDGQMQRKRGRPPKNSTSTSTGDGKKDKEKIKGDRDGTKPNKDKLKEKQKKLEKHSRRLKEEKEGGKKRKRDDSAEGEKKVKKPRKDVSDSDDQPASPILTKAAKKLVEVKTNSSVEGSGEQRKFITKGAMKEMSLNSTNSAPSRSALTSPQSENGSVDHQFGVVLEPEATIVPEETDGELTCPVEVSLAEVVVSDGNAIILPDGSADIIMTVAPSIHEKNEEFVDEATLVNAKTEENDQRLQEMEPSSPNENLGLPETSSPVHPATAESAVESLVKRELMEDAKQLIVLESSISSMELSRQLKEEPIVERLATPPTAPQTTEGRINDQSLPTCDGQRQQHHQLDGSGRILPSHVDKVIDDVVHGYIEMDPDELIKISRQRQLAQQASMPQAVRKSSLSTEGTEPVSRPPQNVPTTSSAAVALPSSLQSQQPVATTTSSSVIREFTESLVSSTDFASHLTSAAAASFINFAQPPYEGLLAAQQQQQQQDYLRHLQQQQQQQKSTSVLVPPGSRLPPSFDIIALQQSAKQPTPTDVKTAQSPFAAFSAVVTSAGNFPPFGGLSTSAAQVRLVGGLHTAPSGQTPTTPTAATPTSGSPSAALQSLDPQIRAFLELQKRNELQNANMWASQAALLAAQQQAAFRNNPAVTAAAVSLAEQEIKLQFQREQQRLLAVDQQRQQQQQQSKSVPPASQPTPTRTSSSQGPTQSQPEVTPNTFKSLVQRYPIVWQGHLALKNDQALVQMHFVSGNRQLPPSSLPVPPANEVSGTPILRIAQRMRLEAQQLDGVARRMQFAEDHCLLLALPCGRDQNDIFLQSSLLQTGFITYLQQKQAAGIVNVSHGNDPQPAYVVHIFPPCDFARKHFVSVADDFHRSIMERQTPYLLIVIATVS